MNKYYKLLKKITDNGRTQQNKKGNIVYLTNQLLQLKSRDLLNIFETHGIARNKLKNELELFQKGERLTERYRNVGVEWWDYVGPIMINSYPPYFMFTQFLGDCLNLRLKAFKCILNAF